MMSNFNSNQEQQREDTIQHKSRYFSKIVRKLTPQQCSPVNTKGSVPSFNLNFQEKQNFLRFPVNDASLCSGNASFVRFQIIQQKWWCATRRKCIGEICVDVKREIGLGNLTRQLMKKNNTLSPIALSFQINLINEEEPNNNHNNINNNKHQLYIYIHILHVHNLISSIFDWNTFSLQIIPSPGFLYEQPSPCPQLLPSEPSELQQGEGITAIEKISPTLLSTPWTLEMATDTFDSQEHDDQFHELSIQLDDEEDDAVGGGESKENELHQSISTMTPLPFVIPITYIDFLQTYNHNNYHNHHMKKHRENSLDSSFLLFNNMIES